VRRHPLSLIFPDLIDRLEEEIPVIISAQPKSLRQAPGCVLICPQPALVEQAEKNAHDHGDRSAEKEP
jgi:hypothetical protein